MLLHYSSKRDWRLSTIFGKIFKTEKATDSLSQNSTATNELLGRTYWKAREMTEAGA